MKSSIKISYSQPTKQLARSEALTHAVTLLTERRQQAAIAPPDYVRAVKKACEKLTYDDEYLNAAENCLEEDVTSWENFRASVVGSLKPEDLTIAYLAGPEPDNDLNTLLGLGVRAENIWAFEIGDSHFESALQKVKDSKIRGVKLIKMKMEDFFDSTPRRFDIIYFDACATFPSNDQKTLRIVSSIFKNSSLNSLGVLITNFSTPDISNPVDLENYSHLISSYLYSKSTLDQINDAELYSSESAEADGFYLSKETFPPEPGDRAKYFYDEVTENFDFYYGSFITRQLMDLSSIISPIERLSGSKIWDSLFIEKNRVVTECKKWLEPVDAENSDFSHAYIFEGGNFSLLNAITYLDDKNAPYPASVKKFIDRWLQQLTECNGKPKITIEKILLFYACRDNTNFWTNSMQELKEFNYRGKMPRLCDMPTEELGFYPIFAQYSYPAHCNVSEVRRFTYIAEDKNNRMFLDILPFDECRYVYDWLSSAHLAAGDLERLSTQLTFRFALDSIVKNIHNYQDDFLYGAHVLPISTEGFEEKQLTARVDLSSY